MRLQAILAVLVLLAGCAQEAGKAPPAGEAPAPETPSEEKPQLREATTIAELLQKAEQLSYSFELVETREYRSGKKEVITSRVWIRGKNVRVEDNTGNMMPFAFPGSVHILSDWKEYYIYNPEDNKAANMTQLLASWKELEKEAKADHFIVFPIIIFPPIPKDAEVVGEETLGGRETTVLRKGNETVWLWREYGIPLKWVSQGVVEKDGTVVERYTTTAEVRNLRMEEVPLSMFELPPGVDIAETQIYSGKPSQPGGMVSISDLESFFGEVAGIALLGRKAGVQRMPPYSSGGRSYETLRLAEYSEEVKTAEEAMNLILEELERRGIEARLNRLTKEVVVDNVEAGGKRGTLYFQPLCVENENCGMQLTFEYEGGG